jgi:hypothetical protein
LNRLVVTNYKAVQQETGGCLSEIVAGGIYRIGYGIRIVMQEAQNRNRFADMQVSKRKIS